jgi:hypothetical protein
MVDELRRGQDVKEKDHREEPAVAGIRFKDAVL